MILFHFQVAVPRAEIIPRTWLRVDRYDSHDWSIRGSASVQAPQAANWLFITTLMYACKQYKKLTRDRFGVVQGQFVRAYSRDMTAQSHSSIRPALCRLFSSEQNVFLHSSTERVHGLSSLYNGVSFPILCWSSFEKIWEWERLTHKLKHPHDVSFLSSKIRVWILSRSPTRLGVVLSGISERMFHLHKDFWNLKA